MMVVCYLRGGYQRRLGRLAGRVHINSVRRTGSPRAMRRITRTNLARRTIQGRVYGAFRPRCA